MMSASNSSLRKREREGGEEVLSFQRLCLILCVCDVTTIPYSFGWCHRCKTMHRCPPEVPIFKGVAKPLGNHFPGLLKTV